MTFSRTRNRPLGYVDTNNNVIPDSFSDESFRGEYSGTNLVYKGFARPGSPTSLNVWQIAQLNYDGSGNVLNILWPLNSTGAPSNDYEFIWDNRHSLTYV